MTIKSINLRNIYSFGDSGTPELKDFAQFNLFIGKNGSGKSNVFRALTTLDLDIVHNKRYQISLSSIVFNKSIHKFRGGVNSQKEKKKDRNLNIDLEAHTIHFEDSIHIEGDYAGLQRSVRYFELGGNFETLREKLIKLANHPNREILLSFVLDYIFGIPIKIQNAGIGEFVNGGLSKGGRHVDLGRSGWDPETNRINSCGWSSGYTAVTNILSQFLLFSRKVAVICLDEPEMNLEPRIIRNLMSVIFWLNSSFDPDHENTKLFLQWIDENQKEFQLDEKKIQYNISLLVDNVFIERQIFISSHSPALINQFISHKDYCAIYEFDVCSELNRYISPNTQQKGVPIEQNCLVSVVRKIPINEYPHNILDNLGAHGSDLLQTNGIIWVEGPSDVIYIKKWLEMYANENERPILRQGTDYEFQMFGGALLDSLCLIKEGLDEEEECKKLVSMFSFSRNAFVVTDSDAVKKDNGKIVDQSNFKNAKEFSNYSEKKD